MPSSFCESASGSAGAPATAPSALAVAQRPVQAGLLLILLALCLALFTDEATLCPKTPEYELSMGTTRTSSTEPPQDKPGAYARLSEDAELVIHLRPKTITSGPIVLEAYVVEKGQLLPFPVRVADDSSSGFHSTHPRVQVPPLGTGTHTVAFKLQRLPCSRLLRMWAAFLDGAFGLRFPDRSRFVFGVLEIAPRPQPAP